MRRGLRSKQVKQRGQSKPSSQALLAKADAHTTTAQEQQHPQCSGNFYVRREEARHMLGRVYLLSISKALLSLHRPWKPASFSGEGRNVASSTVWR